MKPRPGHDDAAAHAAVIALNEADHVAFVIGRAHVNRVALIERRNPGVGLFSCVTGIDQLLAIVRVTFRKQTGQRNFRERGIGIKFGAIRPDDFLRFDHGVQRVRRIAPHRAQIESFENVQHLQRGDALAVRRQFEDIVAAIVRRDRIDPCRCMLLEIDFAQKTAILLHELVDLVRDLAFIKSVAPFLADQSQRFRQRRIFEDVALRRRPAFAVERVSFEKRAG